MDIVGAYGPRRSGKFKMPWQPTTGDSKIRHTASDVEETVWY